MVASACPIPMQRPTSQLRRAARLLLLTSLSVGGAQAAQQASSPRQHPPAEGRVLWMRADRHVGRDIGNTVSSWGEVSGAGTLLTQPVGSERPLLEPIGAGGHPQVRFDGADSRWQSSSRLHR